MIIRLKSFGLSNVLGLALLAGALAFGSCPVRADDSETVTPSQSVEVASVQVLGFVERLETCVSEGRPIESCIEKPQIDTPASSESDQHASATVEESSAAETEPPLAQTGAAILVEITQSVTVAEFAQKDSDQVAEEDHQASDDQHEAINIAPAPADDDAPAGQTAAAIVMEITQSVTIAVPGEIAEENHDPVNVASVPVEDN